MATDAGKQQLDSAFERMIKHCTVIRLLAHTQIRKLKQLHQKKAHMMEIQINGGKNIAEKVQYGKDLFEKPIAVDGVFSENEVVDVIAVSKGHGTKGTTYRWGTRKLQRKTHRGVRRVGCVGSWHPSRIQFSVPRAGQAGYHHRTERNKKIYRIGKSCRENPKVNSASTEFDLTEKNITPLGGFPHYGQVLEDWLMLKGTVPGHRKRVLTLRKSLWTLTRRDHLETVALKFIDTSSKIGRGRYQTVAEKTKFLGPPLKHTKKKTAAAAAAAAPASTA
jgi:large subunit ribosomal protein L3e